MKKSYKIALITAGSVFLLTLLFIYIHIRLVMGEHPDYGIAEGITEGLNDCLEQPFAITPVPKGTFSSFFSMFFLIGAFGFMAYASRNSKKHYNSKKALGDAEWLSGKYLEDYNRHFNEPFGEKTTDGKNNMILSRDLFLSLSNYDIAQNNNFNGRNQNVIAVGGSGVGKTFLFVGPNILQANCCYVITDPSGELYREYGWFLENEGYRVKCFNLDHMEESCHYNPFNYIHNDKDIGLLVTTLMKSTTPPQAHMGDPFWEKAETLLLLALVSLLFHYYKPSCRNFAQLLDMLRAAEVDEENNTESVLDSIMKDIERRDPQGYTVRMYRDFKLAAGRTLKSILVSVAARLKEFELDDMIALTSSDDIDLEAIGDEKTALFIIIPTGQTTFNFLATIMYAQLFMQMYGYAQNTAKYTQIVKDSEGEVVRSFRSASKKPEDIVKAREKAEEFFRNAKEARVVHDKELDLYVIEGKDRSIIKYARERRRAERYLEEIRGGYIEQNERATLPIHTRLILDEYANTAGIPDFPEKVATIRKFGISVTIIVQSLQQMQNLHETEWEAIAGNCDNAIYLGGGADTFTTEWFSKLIGKETRVIMSTTYGSNSGSSSYNLQGQELASPAYLRKLPEDECVVILKSNHAYKGKKYRSTMHRNWKYVKDTEDFIFDEKRMLTIAYAWKDATLSEIEKENRKKGITAETVAVKETEEEKRKREKRNSEEKRKAEEFKENKDPEGEKVIESPKEIMDGYAEENLKVQSSEEVKEVTESLITTDDLDDILLGESIQYATITNQ